MAEQVDVVVVGGASAGYAAAVAARQAGAERVIVLEKARRDEVGGNCRFSIMGFRFVHDGVDDLLEMLPEQDRARFATVHVDPYTADDFRGDLARLTQGRMDPDLAETLVADSRDAVDWMSSLGHRWHFRGPIKTNGEIHYNAGIPLAPIEGGLGLVEHWISVGEELGIELRTQSSVIGLLGHQAGVEGVIVDGPEGVYDLQAAAVVLASGGFQASPERRARYLEANADLMKVRGSRHNTGEIMDMAIALGAKTSGQWQSGHCVPIDAASPEVEIDTGKNRVAYPYGITVNRDGERFFDEGEAHYAYTYAKTGWAVLRQPGGSAFQLFDADSVQYLPDRYDGAKPTVADSLEDLAEETGVNAERLAKTVAGFNTAIQQEVRFDATRKDGKGSVGLDVNKSNWALPLEKPPFYAYEATGGITFTFGGLAINRSAQVLNTCDEPIGGLYANGDILGLFYHNYPSCSGMTRNVVFGGRAGASIAGLA